MNDRERALSTSDLEGYARPYTFRSIALDALVVILIVWSVVALLFSARLLELAMWLRPPPQQWPDYGYLELGVIVAGIVVVHEGLHAVVARAFGLRISFGVRWYGVYTLPYDGRVTRWQKGVVSLTPLVVISVGCLIAYSVAVSTELMTVAILVLLLNGIGSGLDLRNSLRLLRYPRGTVFEKSNRETQTAIYEPEEHAVIAGSMREEADSRLPRDPRDVLIAEIFHWLADFRVAARNRRLRATGRTYISLLIQRFGDWIATQTRPSAHSQPRSTHD